MPVQSVRFPDAWEQGFRVLTEHASNKHMQVLVSFFTGLFLGCLACDDFHGTQVLAEFETQPRFIMPGHTCVGWSWNIQLEAVMRVLTPVLNKACMNLLVQRGTQQYFMWYGG